MPQWHVYLSQTLIIKIRYFLSCFARGGEVGLACLRARPFGELLDAFQLFGSCLNHYETSRMEIPGHDVKASANLIREVL